MYHARYEKALKNHSLFVAEGNVETCSPSNAEALDLEEEVVPQNLAKLKLGRKKELNRRRITDVE